jgi:hypothetical protein
MSKYIDIPKHLQTLLFDYSPVIIPGIGALNTRYKAAQLDENKGIIAPPIKTLELNERMRGNDGLLSSHIARTDKITEAEAETEVKIFTDLLLHKIETNGKAIIEGIGELYRDTAGGLGFAPDPKANFSAETFGLQAIEINKTSESATPLIDEQIPPALGIGSAVVEESIETSSPQPITLAEKLGNYTASDSQQVPTSGKVAAASNANTITNTTSDKAVATVPAKRAKTNWLLWLLPILILALFFGLLSRLSSDKKTTTATTNNESYEQENADNNTANQATATTSNEPATHADNTTSRETASATPDGTTTTPDGLHTVIDGITVTNSQAHEYINTNAPKGYYIIVGAWKNRAKAEEIANNFKKQYNVVLLETNTGTIRIALSMPQSIPEVKTAYSQLRENYPDIWVLRYN